MYSASKIVFNVASFLKPKRVYGVENVPEGPAVICANHAHFSDPFYIIHAIPRRHKIWVMSKDEVRHWPVVGPLLAWSEFIIFVKRGKADIGAVKSALKALKGGEKLLIFPEGTRSKDGKVHAFRNGAFKIAQKANVPIVVCTINGTSDLFHNLKKLKTTHIHLHLVDVIQPEEYKGMSTVALSDMVYEKMIADLGEEFRFTETEKPSP